MASSLVDKLIDRRVRRVGRYRKEVIEYLVRWTGYGPEYDQWVRENDIEDSLTKAYKQSIGVPVIDEEEAEKD